jgi:hypothetical protein
MGDISEVDLEKVFLHSDCREARWLIHSQAVDKLGRTARRTVETHIKNAFSKPRVATAVRRMTAILNFVPDLRKCESQTISSLRVTEIIPKAPVRSTAEKPPLEVKQVGPETTSPLSHLGEQREERHDSSPVSPRTTSVKVPFLFKDLVTETGP